jgi:hypothetical protein
MDVAERRRLERFDLTAPAKVLVASGISSNTALQLTTKDVSSGGAYLYCPQPMAEGARVKMDLVLSLDKLYKLVGESGRARIRVRGTVIRVDADGMAIQFESRYRITALASSALRAGSC